MLVVLKREKAGAVHYAKRVTPNGVVDRWTADRPQAAEIAATLADKAQAVYAARPSVTPTTLTAEPVKLPDPEPKPVKAAEPGKPSKPPETKSPAAMSS